MPTELKDALQEVLRGLLSFLDAACTALSEIEDTLWLVIEIVFVYQVMTHYVEFRPLPGLYKPSAALSIFTNLDGDIHTVASLLDCSLSDAESTNEE